MSLATEGFSAMINCLLMCSMAVAPQKLRSMISTKNPAGKFRGRPRREKSPMQALEQAARQCGNAAFELELSEQRGGVGGGKTAARGERVGVDGIVSERREQRRGVRVVDGVRSTRVRGWGRQAQLLQHIGGALDELRALLDEGVTALGERGVDRPRNGEDFPSLFGSESRGDERAAVRRRLHHEAAEREPA